MSIRGKKIEELKSELFALINTIIQLNTKYLDGVLDDNFFKKSLKAAINHLIDIHFKLDNKNVDISNIIESMNFKQEYDKAISIINTASLLNTDISDYSNAISSSLLQIPASTAEIASSFITLMDGLKLVEQDNLDLIFRLFQELLKNLDKFPGLGEIKSKISSIFDNLKTHKNKFYQIKAYRNSLIDEVYTMYSSFQQKLRLKNQPNNKIN